MPISNRFLIGALVLCLGGQAFAQPTDLNAPPNKEWRHKPTKVRLPPTLLNLQRQKVVSFGGNDTDVAGDYWSADGSETVTIYLYRNVDGNVPVWFDRARTIINLVPEKYGTPISTGARPFTPRGQRATAGLMEIFTVSGKDFRSTGVMVLPVNGFYAKVRASSNTRDAAGLEQLMLAAVNAMNWTSGWQEVAAAPVADCPSPLPPRAPAKMAAASSDDEMMSALIGGLVSQSVSLDAKKAVPIAYCRERSPAQIPYGVYRPVGSANGFLLALVDSGRTISVGSSLITQILAEQKKPNRVSVSHVEMEATSTFPDFETLPLPGQAFQLVQNGNPLSVASTWGDKRDVQIRAK